MLSSNLGLSAIWGVCHLGCLLWSRALPGSPHILIGAHRFRAVLALALCCRPPNPTLAPSNAWLPVWIPHSKFGCDTHAGKCPIRLPGQHFLTCYLFPFFVTAHRQERLNENTYSNLSHKSHVVVCPKLLVWECDMIERRTETSKLFNRLWKFPCSLNKFLSYAELAFCATRRPGKP